MEAAAVDAVVADVEDVGTGVRDVESKAGAGIRAMTAATGVRALEMA
jgi:hypothetical protein